MPEDLYYCNLNKDGTTQKLNHYQKSRSNINE